MKINDTVEFLDHVYQGAWAPYYDAYKGHKFRIFAWLKGDELDENGDYELLKDHAFLECITGNVPVAGCVHTFDLRLTE